MTKKTYSIGIDIGGTKMMAVLFDGKDVLAEFILATPKDSLDHFMVMLQALIGPIFEKCEELKIKIDGIGIGLAGVIDRETGKMLYSPNIPIINNVNIGELLKEKINLLIKIDNDGNCFTLAEALLGAGRKYDNVYGIIVGTGIGGGWYFDNKIYQTKNGGSGEPGQMIVDFHSGTILEKAFHDLTEKKSEELAEKAYYGDVQAEGVFMNLGNLLGFSFASIVNIISPEIIVVGGGVTEASDLFLGQAKKIMKKNIASRIAAKKIKLAKSKLGKQAGAIGAALMIK
ncbi:hypothetical protein A2331_03845 [Candidatus Falkowbacteria bacterium RIFOXYB2_FULL_34_18]|uniref:Sugar kinase n=1 Tax=Candidatus Falkowbacteria bacterium RIFOXYD2_FULL_34_120 TaxID=1798007 RepID=A0A1F5TPM1_9BACT|nr:MAG: hypothetical protein A2331_03845 [Candidatus Falkowbacteria bacterium RIFOXYB2_FULL_34_18]OGF29085.1 MAG: hypothetical protein A2500_03170 [Candidatus Falkowbacteria bacterium RIFOXYC12_FULL_34_55]OGF36168.1 MAG: hypothetical protein A2466_04700 [Candidatus Falkowbacteria bacterium RIFOXYC2_FULL_34_220]OGF38595.1 MAG: hypothetical protein A2515_02060 [Candidatus Falkowbacteria bacterium RIFOXYD12_FULL_34_57]OGF40778.1 MAG: hypothetical protein A2531_06705 [Candidatus Falkowbacteria bact